MSSSVVAGTNIIFPPSDLSFTQVPLALPLPLIPLPLLFPPRSMEEASTTAASVHTTSACIVFVPSFNDTGPLEPEGWYPACLALKVNPFPRPAPAPRPPPLALATTVSIAPTTLVFPSFNVFLTEPLRELTWSFLLLFFFVYLPAPLLRWFGLPFPPRFLYVLVAAAFFFVVVVVVVFVLLLYSFNQLGNAKHTCDGDKTPVLLLLLLPLLLPLLLSLLAPTLEVEVLRRTRVLGRWSAPWRTTTTLGLGFPSFLMFVLAEADAEDEDSGTDDDNDNATPRQPNPFMVTMAARPNYISLFSLFSLSTKKTKLKKLKLKAEAGWC